jgi:hypothetical protein
MDRAGLRRAPVSRELGHPADRPGGTMAHRGASRDGMQVLSGKRFPSSERSRYRGAWNGQVWQAFAGAALLPTMDHRGNRTDQDIFD